MKNFKKNRGFITSFVLFFIGGTILIGAGELKKNCKEQKERNKFYGQYVSAAEEKELLKKNTFYFRFNSYALQDRYKLPLFANARKLLKHPELKVYINGHTDNKGTITYNLKLGMLRAKSVADVLASKGVDLNNMVTISYADQLPIGLNIDKKFDYDEEKSDRRANIVYIQKDEL